MSNGPVIPGHPCLWATSSAAKTSTFCRYHHSHRCPTTAGCAARSREKGFRRQAWRTDRRASSDSGRGIARPSHTAPPRDSDETPRPAGGRPEPPQTANRGATSRTRPGTSRGKRARAGHPSRRAAHTTYARWRNPSDGSRSGLCAGASALPPGCVRPRPATARDRGLTVSGSWPRAPR